jgi:hypothetical protein
MRPENCLSVATQAFSYNHKSFMSSYLRIRLSVIKGVMKDENQGRLNWFGDFGNFLFGVNQEVVGIQVLLTRSVFACDILRRFLPRVSLAKPTSAPVRC